MAKVRWITPGPDDPMYKEGYRSYSPHWARPPQDEKEQKQQTKAARKKATKKGKEQ